MDDKPAALTAAKEVIAATGIYSLYTNANWVNSWSSQLGANLFLS